MTMDVGGEKQLGFAAGFASEGIEHCNIFEGNSLEPDPQFILKTGAD